MKNKIIVWIFGIFLIVLSGMVNADLNDNLNLYLGYYDGYFDDTETWVTSGMSGSHTNVSCINGGCYDFDSADDMDIEAGSINKTFAINLWFNPDTIDTSSDYIIQHANPRLYIFLDEDISIRLGSDTGELDFNDGAIGSWQMATLNVFANDSYFFYINSTLVGNGNIPSWNYPNIAWTIGTNYDGLFDEFGLWNRTLSEIEITDLWNSGTGLFPIAGVFGGGISKDTLNISTDVYPLSETQFSFNDININTTVNSTYFFNCSLYIDDAFNQTKHYATGGNTFVDFDITIPNGNYSYFISCFNSTGFGHNNENTTARHFFVDSTNSTLASHNFINNSVYVYNNMTGEFNITDDANIYSINVSIDGTQIFYSGINKTTYTYNLSYNTSYLSIGSHNLSIAYANGYFDNINTVTNEFVFYHFNVTLDYSNVVLENERQYIHLRMNKTTGFNTNASLVYNNTRYTATKTSYSNYDLYNVSFITEKIVTNPTYMLFHWDYNYTGLSTNTGNLSGNQSVYKIGIDNCSTYTMRALNISVYNEGTNTFVSLPVSIAAYFEVWIDAENDYRTFNLSWESSNNYSICINPNWSTYTVYSQFEYSATGYETKYYYFTNETLNNQTSDLYLYLTNDTTAVTFTVTDENDNEVEDAYIHILSYDLGTNSYKTTEILKTDSQGAAIGNVILNTQWYKFIIYYDGEIVLDSSATKILTTSYSFQVNLGEDYFETYDLLDDVSCEITFNDATNNFVYTYSDGSGSVVQGCMNIIKRTINGDSVINTSCVSSASASIILGVGNYTDSLYIAQGNVKIGDNVYICGDPKSHDFSSRHLVFGSSGLFVSFLIILTLVTVGIWNPVIAVILMMVGVIVSNLLDLYFLDWEILVSFIIIGGITLYRLRK